MALKKNKKFYLRLPRRVIFCLLCAGLVGRISISGDVLNQNFTINSNTNNATTTTSREPKLADGCYHVLLDIGSNTGMHVRFLFEPQKYPKARIARGVFNDHFGSELTRDNRDFCVFSFEPNPAQLPRHADMKNAYTAMGWRYLPIHAGVSDADGNLTFYHIGDETGFTMLKSSCRKRCDPEYVPILRLSDWIDREVHGREIPEPHALHEKGPRVVMKMDIEMMEWLVFPDLLDTGVLCRDVNGIMGEFHLRRHWFFYPITFERSRLGDNYTISNWKDAQILRNGYLSRIGKDPNCTLDMKLKDDESHREDGMPWPTPTNDTDSLNTNGTKIVCGGWGC